MTSAMASRRVVTTSRIDSDTTDVVSKAISTFNPGGNRFDNLAGGQPAAGEAIGIEPQAHRIAPLAEDLDVSDTGHPLDLVSDEPVDVVADELRVVLAIVRKGAGRQHEVARDLRNRDAD